MSRSESVNSGAVASRPSISAPRILPPASSGTHDQRADIGAQPGAGRCAAVAVDQSGLAGQDRLPGRRVRQRRCPVHQIHRQRAAYAGHDRLIGLVRSPTSRRSRPPRPTAACCVINVAGGAAAPDSRTCVSSADAASHRRRCSDSANRRAFAIAAPAAAASAMASCSSSAVNSSSAGALGEIEVAENLLTDADRDTDEAGHRRMSRRESRGHGMSGQIGSLIGTAR